MDEELLENIFKFVMFALWVGWRVRKAQKEKAERAGPAPAPAPAPIQRRTAPAPAPAPAGNAAEVARWVATLTRLEARMVELEAQRATLEAAVWKLGARARLFRSLYDTRVAPPLDAAATMLVGLRRELGAAGAQAVSNRMRLDPDIQRGISDMARADRELGVLVQLAEMRTDAELGPMLADADAIAARLLGPVQQFCDAQDIDFPSMEVVTAPGTGGESVWMGLLPDDHPLVVVPDDFGDDLFRWPSIAHEIGHVLWWKVPGFADELRAVAGVGTSARLFRRERGPLLGNLEQPLAAWLPELVADAFTVLFLGPAALYGFTHVFARPDQPRAVLQAHDDGRGRYEEHPPAHLRVRLAAGLLDHLGFETRTRGEVARWDELHGFDENAGAEGAVLPLFLPVDGGQDAAVSVELFVAHTLPMMIRLVETQYDALSGFAPTSVPGLEMTPGFWQKVERRAVDLHEGVPFRDAADVVLAAAIVARHRNPGDADIVESNLRQAILGKDTGVADRAERRLAARRRAAAGDSLAAAVRDAIVLGEVLPRRSPGQPPVPRLFR